MKKGYCGRNPALTVLTVMILLFLASDTARAQDAQSGGEKNAAVKTAPPVVVLRNAPGSAAPATLDSAAVEISAAEGDPDIDAIAGEEVEFTLTAKRRDGSVVLDWDATGVATTLTITGSTANTDTSNRSWNADPLGYKWSVITCNGQSITQSAPDEYSLPNSAFVSGTAKIRITHTKAESGVRIVCSPMLAGLRQTSARMNFAAGAIGNFMIDITSSTQFPDQVFLQRLYEIVVSPRDRFLNVSSEQVETRFTARWPGEYDKNLPGLSTVFSGTVFITGPSNYFLASRITRIKGQDELAWVQCRGVADTNAIGRSAPYEILHHAPNEFFLDTPVDRTLWWFYSWTPEKQVQFTWRVSTPPDPYTDIPVSRFDPRRYTDTVHYNIVFVDSASLTRAVKFEADSAGRLARHTTNHRQLRTLIETISGQKTITSYQLVWFVEATDGMYTTLAWWHTPDTTPQYGHHLDLRWSFGDGIEELPQSFELGLSYPNPFHTATAIAYTLPNPAHVTLTVFDLLGTRVKTLVREMTANGGHTTYWDGSDESGRRLPSGTYLLRMLADDVVQTRVLTLMR